MRAALAIALLLPAALQGQSVVSAQPALFHHVEGLALLNQDALTQQAVDQTHAVAGDQLRTHRGFAEVLLDSATVLRSGGISALRFDALEPGRFELTLLGGSLILDLADDRRERPVRIHIEDWTIELDRLGVYRLDLPADAAPSMRIFQGRAAVHRDGKTTAVKSGKRFEFVADSKRESFDPKLGDGFDGWAAQRRVQLVDELLASLPTEQDPGRRRASDDPLESLRAIHRQTEAEIRSSEAADSLWVK